MAARKARQRFDVDVAGMRAVAMRNGAAFVLLELVQNALDEPITQVAVELWPAEGRRNRAHLVVADDSAEGFKDLRHAWTLYGRSPKRDDPTKRGFMDRGEKFVIACCEWAEIRSSTGGVRFDDHGRQLLRSRRERGTTFEALVKLTREEVDEAVGAGMKIIPPPATRVVINGKELDCCRLVTTVRKVSLDTIVPDEEGVMRRRQRQTEIRVWQPRPGEVGTLYELGMPVVETGDTFHYDVSQRIPVTEDRNSVSPGFLSSIRVAVLNATAALVPAEATSLGWVRQARGDQRISDDAARIVYTKQFGPGAVAADPSDPEATNRAVGEGVKVVWGPSLTSEEWAIVRRAGVLPPAGRVYPSPKPNLSDDRAAPFLRMVSVSRYSRGMRSVVDYVRRMSNALLERDDVVVDVMNEPVSQGRTLAWYSPGHLTLNVGRLGHKWFDEPDLERIDALVLHEVGHDAEQNHLSENYHEGLCQLGARWARLLVAQPGLANLPEVRSISDHTLAESVASGAR